MSILDVRDADFHYDIPKPKFLFVEPTDWLYLNNENKSEKWELTII